MPTYDYVCNACDHEFELFQLITAGAKRKCPECGRFKLRRLIGPGAAIVFKGSGFYKTDYRSESYKKGAEKAKKPTDKSSSDKSSSDKNQSSGKSKSEGKSSGTAAAKS